MEEQHKIIMAVVLAVVGCAGSAALLWSCWKRKHVERPEKIRWDAQFAPLAPAAEVLNVGFLGLTGAGKSNVINRLRCLQCEDTGFAEVGTSTTTAAVAQYMWESAAGRICLYDTPGIGGHFAPDWGAQESLQYFKDMDVVVLVYSNTVTPFDSSVVRLAGSSKPLLLVVRAKADVLVATKMRPRGFTTALEEACARVQGEAALLGIEEERFFLVSSSEQEDAAIHCSHAGTLSMLQDRLLELCGAKYQQLRGAYLL